MSVEEARETLAYLRKEAATHTFISTWTVVEMIDQALEQLAEPPAAQRRPDAREASP